MKEVINIEGTVFDAARNDFDSVLKNTLATMRKNGSTSATLTLKIDIALLDQREGDRTMVVPTFGHKVTSAIQTKEERAGKFGGKHEMYYDETYDNFAVVEIPPIEGQMNLPFV